MNIQESTATIDKTTISNWFTERGLSAYDYQIEIIHELLFDNDQEKPKVLAACPSAGKTFMSICLIDLYIQLNPNAKVLVLAHGTKVLRSQFHDNITGLENKPNFDAVSLESSSDYTDAYQNNNVIITLPQTMSGVRLVKKGSFDMIVVDEAHEFFFADTVKNIINKVQPKKIVPLTGTPSKFIYDEYPIIPVTVNELLEIPNRIEDLIVELASSTYNFDDDDYNSGDELKSKAYNKINKKDTEATLDSLLDSVIKKLKSVWRANPKAYATQKNITGWSDALKAMRKTMIACKSQKQAIQIKNYLESKNINTALSISPSDDVDKKYWDKDSTEIDRFVKDDDCLVLLVVGRGILGFSLSILENVIDMTCSKNIDRTFQLMCRVLRKHPDGRKKLFFKVSPTYLAEYFRYVMTFVLLLTDKEYYTKYNGKNFLKMKIPVKKKTKTETKDGSGDGTKKKNKSSTIKPIVYEDLPAIEFFRDLLHKDNNELSSYAWTTMSRVRSGCLGFKNQTMTTEEFIKKAMEIHR